MASDRERLEEAARQDPELMLSLATEMGLLEAAPQPDTAPEQNWERIATNALRDLATISELLGLPEDEADIIGFLRDRQTDTEKEGVCEVCHYAYGPTSCKCQRYVPGGRSTVAADEGKILDLMRKAGVKWNTYQRCKDGIEVDYPSPAMLAFVRALLDQEKPKGGTRR